MNTKIAGIVGRVFQFGIGIIGGIMFLMILLKGDESMISSSITLSMWAIYIAAGIAVLFGIYHFVTNIKNNKKSLIGIVAFTLIVIISRVIAKGQDTTADLMEKADEGQILMTDTGLYMFYILIGITILVIIFAEVSRLFK
jgi:carbon starvation protein CstA